MRLSAMGDVAMTVPVLRAFVKRYPDVKLTVISRPFFRPFFDGIQNVDFLAFDEKERHKGFLGLLRLYSDLKKLNIDAFADLHNVLRSKIIGMLFSVSGKKTATVDKARAEKKALTRPENKVFKQLPMIYERHVKVFEELGFPFSLSNPEFPKKQEPDSEVVSLIGEKNQKWIGIAPFGQHDSKVYPLDLMRKVIEVLSENEYYKIFLFGGKDETGILNSLAANNKNTVVIAGKINFRQELQLISNLDIMLSMDSGNAHIAAMLGINVITLWGNTHPFAGFLPFNQPIESALVSDQEKFPKIPTSVYGNKKVDGYEDVMRTITPETIIQKVNNALGY
jgi:ADP-heptose:LPS heptosyltransferase